MPLRLLVGLLAALTLAAPFARAADPAAQARELFQRGEAALADGHSKEAIEDFEAAYKAGNSPSLLFYLAKAHQLAGDDAKALAEYQLYLQKVPNGPKRAEAEESIAALKPVKPASPRKVAVDEISLAPVPPPAKKKVELDEMDLAENPKAPAAKAPAPASAAAAKSSATAAAPAANVPAANAKGAAKAAAAESKRERRRRKKAEADAAATAEASHAAATAPAAPATAVVVKTPAAPPTVAVVVTPAPPPATVVHEAPPPASAAPQPPPPAPALVALPPPSVETIPPPAPTSAPVEHAAMIATPPPSPAPAPVVAEAQPLIVPNQPLRSHDVAPYKPPEPPPPAFSLAPAAPALIQSPPPVEEHSQAMRNTGLILGTAGIAALATGGLFGVGAQSAASDLNTDANSGLHFDPNTQTRGQRDQKLEIAFLAGGAACLVTGAILFIVSPSSGSESASNESAPKSVSLGYASVVPLSGGAAAAAGLRF